MERAFFTVSSPLRGLFVALFSWHALLAMHDIICSHPQGAGSSGEHNHGCTEIAIVDSNVHTNKSTTSHALRLHQGAHGSGNASPSSV